MVSAQWGGGGGCVTTGTGPGPSNTQQFTSIVVAVNIWPLTPESLQS